MRLLHIFWDFIQDLRVVSGGLYLSLIPLYAFFYLLIAGDFSSSTVHLDPNFKLTTERIARQIESTINECEHPGPQIFSVIDTNDYTIEIITKGYEGLGDRPHAHGSLQFLAADVSQPGAKPEWQQLARTAYESSSGRVSSVTYQIWVPFRIVTSVSAVHETALVNKLESCFGLEKESLSWEGQTGVTIEQDLAEQIDALFGAKQHGYDAGVHNQYLRFLYFSTVTITTLGYGDILPVTDRARALTASQSILGVLLIGLFLNSVARNR
ncbi:potassium channel family protein [uncultured Tateyamaria sp.]|uniref:potassium channel family protein n=1 Tax=uncultured Tateyamaria sp. TaxID=455651 RepID=UPI0026085E2E|nr:potassium channel family protein [uncultured Tateyamaria sp.]